MAARKSKAAAASDPGPDMDLAERISPQALHEPMHDARGHERTEHRQTAAEYIYKPPMHLDAPEPNPGMVQRWVRAEFRSESDNLNWQTKLREGWRPRDPKSVEQSEYFFGQASKTGQDVIKVGGLVLMEIPEAQLAAKRRAIHQKTIDQERSVSMDTDRASADGRAIGHSPIQRQHETRVSTGRRPPTLAD